MANSNVCSAGRSPQIERSTIETAALIESGPIVLTFLTSFSLFQNLNSTKQHQSSTIKIEEMSLTSSISNLKNTQAIQNGDPVAEATRFISYFGDTGLFTFIKETSHKQLDKLSTKQKEISVGYFHLLPDEIFIQVLKYLTVTEMGTFSLTNTKIRNFIIENFIINSYGYQYTIRASQLEYDPSQENQAAILTLFSSIGKHL